MKLTTQKLKRVEAEMAKMPQAEVPITHRFHPGIYVRTMHLAAGTMITSARHRTDHPWVLTKGKALVSYEDDETPQRLEAPYIGATEPGTKRIIFALTDVEWTTFHATDKTDVEEIAAEILEPETEHLPEGFVPGYQREQNLPCSN